MLEKIINSMFYGNLKTKIFLWAMLLLVLATAFFLLAGLVLGIPSMAFGGVGFGLVALIVSQSVSVNDLEREREKKASSDGKNDKNGEQEDAEAKKAATRKQKDKLKAQYLSSINAKDLKKTMKSHKVNQIHVKVMIDSYPAKKIEQAPAFMWRTDTKLHFMVLSDKADEFEVPLSDITGFLLVKNVPVNPEQDYRFFRVSNYISGMFRPYLPEYYESSKEGKLAIHKNTFRIEPGIYLTNSSVANLRRVLLPGVAFLVDDSVMQSRRFNEYFKELYRSSLLCKNLVITLDEYKEQTTETLDALLEAPIEGSEFVATLSDLKKYQLIDQECLTKYVQRYREIKMTKKEG